MAIVLEKMTIFGNFLHSNGNFPEGQISSADFNFARLTPQGTKFNLGLFKVTFIHCDNDLDHLEAKLNIPGRTSLN